MNNRILLDLVRFQVLEYRNIETKRKQYICVRQKILGESVESSPYPLKQSPKKKTPSSIQQELRASTISCLEEKT